MTCPRTYATSDFDFDLPPQLIAQHPAATRSASRLLDGTGAAPADRRFADLPGLLREGDLLVLNDTQVVKARLFGEKPSGGKLELLVERVLADGTVAAHMRASKKPPVGARLRMAGGTEQGGFEAELLGRWPQADGALFHLRFSGDAYALMAAHGHVPLPPYITHADGAEDEARYQTVFAARPGAVAAPTASLHFDEAVLQALAARGVQRAFVTLHVGAGTFQPVKTERLSEHQMHAERYDVPAATQEAIAACRARRPRGGGGHHQRAQPGGMGGHGAGKGRHAHLHHAGLSLSGGGHAPDQFPPAAQHAHDAGERLRRPRARDGAVPPRHCAALPLFQLWRRHAAGAAGVRGGSAPCACPWKTTAPA